jgi:glutamine amidotransferase
MTTVIIDYESGNLRSAEKSFQRMAAETGAGDVRVTADAGEVARAGRIVLPGVGAFADCRRGLDARPGMIAALREAVIGRGVPFLGICVGQQLLGTVGREFGHDAPGLGWIPGEVVPLAPADPGLKVPHMGWNALVIDRPHPLLEGIATGDHAYFVHSFHLVPDDAADRIAHADHGQCVTAMVGRDNIAGTQFHPEKSQATGLRLIANFLRWRP